MDGDPDIAVLEERDHLVAVDPQLLEVKLDDVEMPGVLDIDN